MIELKRNSNYPIYLQLADALREKIDTGVFKINQPLPKEGDFSKMLKINHLTLRKAMKTLERDGRIFRVRGKGTFVKEQNALSISDEIDSVGKIMCVAGVQGVEDGLGGAICAASTKSFFKKNFRVVRVISTSPDDEQKKIKREQGVISGLILHSSFAAKEEMTNVKYYSEVMKMPVVVVANIFKEVAQPFDQVISDDYKGAIEALKYFFDTGHTKIVSIFPFQYPIKLSDRYRAYSDFMASKQLRKKVITLEYSSHLKSQTILAFEKTIEMLKNNRSIPTAIMTANDAIAIGVYKALLKLGVRIPEDIEVIGFGDIFNISSYMKSKNLPISTVRINCAKIGQEAVRSLLSRLNNPNLPFKTKKISTKIIHRGTTKSSNKQE